MGAAPFRVVTGAFEDAAVDLVVEDGRGEVVDACFDLRDIDQLSFPCLVTMVERRTQRGLRISRRDEVGVGAPG